MAAVNQKLQNDLRAKEEELQNQAQNQKQLQDMIHNLEKNFAGAGAN